MPAAASIAPSLTDVPSASDNQSSGNVAFDNQYFYVKYNGWKRFPLIRTPRAPFGFPDAAHNGDLYCDNQYFYITVKDRWMRLPIFVIKPLRPIMGDVVPVNIQQTKLTTFPRGTDNYGRWGMISFNAEYFCIWGQGKWHKVPVARFLRKAFAADIEPLPPPAPPSPPKGAMMLEVALA